MHDMAPKSAAEKQKRYREKLKNENPEKLKAMKKKNAERSLAYYRNKIKNLKTEKKKENKEENDKRKKSKTETQGRENISIQYAESQRDKKKIHRRIDNKTREETQQLRDDIQKLWKVYRSLQNKSVRQQKRMDELHATCDGLQKNLYEIQATNTPDQASPFSWQTVTKKVVDEDNDAEDAGTFCIDLASDDDNKPETLCDEAQLVPDPCERDSATQEEYTCNVCQERIIGFRYVCVVCPDWDLCGACEARAHHSDHYVLRVPKGKNHSETASVLATLRQMLVTPEEPDVTLVKQEVKTEDPLAGMEGPCELQDEHTDRDVLEIQADPVAVDMEDTATDKRPDIHKPPVTQKKNLATTNIKLISLYGEPNPGIAETISVDEELTILPNPPRKRKIIPLPLTAVYSKKPEKFAKPSSKSAIAFLKKKTQKGNSEVISLDDGISNIVQLSDSLKMEHEPSTSEPYRMTTQENIAIASLDDGNSNIVQLSESVKIEHKIEPEHTSETGKKVDRTEHSEVISDDSSIKKVPASDRDEIEHLIAWSHKDVKDKPMAYQDQLVVLEDMGRLGNFSGTTETNSDDEIRTASYERRSKRTRKKKKKRPITLAS